mgnify:CR=1 FL=1
MMKGNKQGSCSLLLVGNETTTQKTEKKLVFRRCDKMQPSRVTYKWREAYKTRRNIIQRYPKLKRKHQRPASMFTEPLLLCQLWHRPEKYSNVKMFFHVFYTNNTRRTENKWESLKKKQQKKSCPGCFFPKIPVVTVNGIRINSGCNIRPKFRILLYMYIMYMTQRRVHHDTPSSHHHTHSTTAPHTAHSTTAPQHHSTSQHHKARRLFCTTQHTVQYSTS